MAERIFIRRAGQLLPLTHAPYASEDALQALLADHLELVPGDEIDAAEPRRWLLVAREIALPGEERGAAPFALDHLLLDQAGVPTLIEVKRLTDTRIRREVIGQLLDYAARAGTGWTADWLREQHAGRCRGEDIDPDEEIVGLLGPEADAERFWSAVKANLDRGRVRLVFLADEIPTDLRRVVEFLNRQMSPAEVLAVEIRQFAGGDLQMYVPRVYGQTIATQERKSGSSATRWDEESFFAALGERSGEPSVRVARAILDWARQKDAVWWGRGARVGAFGASLHYAGINHNIFTIYSYGALTIYLQSLIQRPAFARGDLRTELLRRLGDALGPGVPVDPRQMASRPSIPLSKLEPPAVLAAFLSVMDWVVDTIRRGPPVSPDPTS